MAKKIELKHTGDVLNFDIPLEETDTPEQHHNRLTVHREKSFEANNRQIYNDLLSNYEQFSEQFERGTDDEQIQLLNRFNQLKEFTGWMIGDFLLRIEASITTRKKSGYNSLRDYLDINEELLGFGKSTGYDYINARKNVSIEQFRRIGIRKAVAVSKIQDDVVRQEVIEQVIAAPKMTEKDVKMIVAEYKESAKHEKEVEKKKELKVVNRIAACDITEKKDSIVIKPHDSSMVPYFYEALRKYEMQIKAEAKRIAERDD